VTFDAAAAAPAGASGQDALAAAADGGVAE
jgi:hypothetical protein